MQVKTQKQVMVLQNKAQKVADKLNEEVIVIAKGVQHIQVQSGTALPIGQMKLCNIHSRGQLYTQCQLQR
jgi:hypothetical protein